MEVMPKRVETVDRLHQRTHFFPQVGKLVGAHAERIHRLRVHEGAVVGVLHEQRAIGNGLAELFQGGEAVLLELVGRPAANHLR